ncbi:hypothetical protein CRYUN_Cryun19dG0019100 [Craigia yunnanensis]
MIYVKQLTQMEEDDRGRPLPKFGEWDVNNPATVIFNKARDEKKTRASNGKITSPEKIETVTDPPPSPPKV